jgi:hypothetical protein
MLPHYNDHFDWATNIADLASKLRSLVDERVKTRPTLPEYELQSFDAHTVVLMAQAKAAESGRLWWDPAATVIPEVVLNPVLMEWYKQANKRGKLESPGDLIVSRHASDPTFPLLIKR